MLQLSEVHGAGRVNFSGAVLLLSGSPYSLSSQINFSQMSQSDCWKQWCHGKDSDDEDDYVADDAMV